MKRLLAKLGYYLSSIPTILGGFSNWPAVIRLFLQGKSAEPVTIQLRVSGLQYRVRSAMDAWIIKETCLDRDYDRLCAPVQDGWNIIDIGAGLGDYTIWAAQAAPHGRVFAYEPFTQSVRLLERNLQANQIRNVRVFNEAVSGTAGVLTLEELGAAVQHTTSAASGKAVRHEVPAVTLAQALERLDGQDCDLLKIDCEGAEYDILMNADPACWRHIRHIVMEYHDHLTEHTHADLVRFFEGLGQRAQVTPNPVHQEIGFLTVHFTQPG